MKRVFAVTIACVAAIVSAGCAGSGTATAPPATAPRAAPGAVAPCQGTLGLELSPLPRAMRKKLSLSDRAPAAVVSEVTAGGPAETAGIRVKDIVEKIGVESGSAGDCDLDRAAYGRSCDPVSVSVRRGANALEIKVLPVDQFALFEKSCRDGQASACQGQARVLWARNRGADRERALELFGSACRAGSAEACSQEGFHRMNAAEGSRDAVRPLGRACDLGSAGGCATFAFLYATGKLVARDDRKATGLYVRSCDLGDAKGCYNVGLMAGDGRGGPRDVSKAVAAYREACEMGSSSACTNLAFQYENGLGVKADRARAFALYQRGCDGTACQVSNLNGCVNVGRCYRDGKGVEKNAARAASIFREACDRKARGEDADPDSEESGSRACSLLGGLYIAGEDGIDKDLQRGLELSVLGCDRGDAFGCFNAAAVFSSGPGADAGKAASFLEKACSHGDAEGCHDLGNAYEKGMGVGRDRRRAVELYRRACQLGFKQACSKNVR